MLSDSKSAFLNQNPILVLFGSQQEKHAFEKSG
jgi:hypothetical protein